MKREKSKMEDYFLPKIEMTPLCRNFPKEKNDSINMERREYIVICYMVIIHPIIQ